MVIDKDGVVRGRRSSNPGIALSFSTQQEINNLPPIKKRVLSRSNLFERMTQFFLAGDFESLARLRKEVGLAD
jgi:hypothetical protein